MDAVKQTEATSDRSEKNVDKPSKSKSLSIFETGSFCKDKFKHVMLVSPDAANILSTSINLGHENFQIADAEYAPDKFYGSETTDKKINVEEPGRFC